MDKPSFRIPEKIYRYYNYADFHINLELQYPMERDPTRFEGGEFPNYNHSTVEEGDMERFENDKFIIADDNVYSILPLEYSELVELFRVIKIN